MTVEEKSNLLNELLEYEENNDIGNLTRAERREFQQWISEALDQETCEDCIREIIREFDNKHPVLFADYMREFNNHPIAEIIEYMWDMHDLIEDIKYRLPNKDGAEMNGGEGK